MNYTYLLISFLSITIGLYGMYKINFGNIKSKIHILKLDYLEASQHY